MPETEVKQMKRVFIYKDERIADPDPNMTPDEVIESLSVLKPELVCGFLKKTTPNEEDDSEMLYEIQNNIGIKA
jgi:PRTRC genetic system protein C